MPSSPDQRTEKRLPIKVSIFVSGDSFQRFKTQTTDFSDGGLFIESKILALLAADTLIKVQAAERSVETPLLTARIAWTNRYGAGVEYLLDD